MKFPADEPEAVDLDPGVLARRLADAPATVKAVLDQGGRVLLRGRAEGPELAGFEVDELVPIGIFYKRVATKAMEQRLWWLAVIVLFYYVSALEQKWMGVDAKAFGNDEQRMLYRLLRSTWNSRMYPLDVKSPSAFHTRPHWGGERGQPIGRYYLHRWLEQIDEKMSKDGPKRCLEIGDGHFIKAGQPRAWKQRPGKMLRFCSSESLSLDLVDPRADIHADLEDPFNTLKEKRMYPQLKQGFDVIVCLQVFEHVNYPVDAIQGLATLLRPGGTVLFSVPFLGNPIHGHDVSRFTTTGVANLATKAGLNVVSNEGLGNSLTTLGYLLDLAAEDFTEKELATKDPHQYVGVYSILKKESRGRALLSYRGVNSTT